MSPNENESLTIEELSFRCGVTTRNIRAYQSRGLLPPPESRAGERVGYYGLAHIGRLRLISRLQERGFSLAGIADLLQAWQSGHSLDQVVGVESVVAEGQEDHSQLVTEAQFRKLLPAGLDADGMIAHLRALGLLVREGNYYRLRQPNILKLGLHAATAGVPLADMLPEFARMQKDAHRIARRFVRLFERHVWQPYVDAGMPSERLDDVIDQMKKLRAAAIDAIGPLMATALAEEIENAADKNLPQQAAEAAE